MNYYKILSWIALMISVLLLILPKYIPICVGHTNDGHPMLCHYAYQAEFIITLLAVILSSSLLVLHTVEARSLASFIIFLLGIIVIILPQSWAIGICENGACLKTTFFVTIGGSILALIGLFILLITRKTESGEVT
ncbi:DUF4418 family protein [Pelosinus sp. sgz500959]|uniref:DUF4418 family protein n=1 Tax=Pelosinus sp. sgz500959 TaxID=3242472 RepID=UPI00366DA5D5